MDQDKIEQLKPFNEENYKNVDLDHLVLYAMGQLANLNIDLSFENAVVAAFRLFPKKFTLLGYSGYPDSDRVMNCLNRCTLKSKQWLVGKPRQGFIITERSKKYIKEAEDLLGDVKQEKTKAPSQTRRKEVILVELTASPAYTKYIDGQSNSISESEICYLLQGTLDSDRKTLKGNLATLKIFSEELNRNDVLQFLNWLEDKFQKFLEEKRH
jgi:hypothetical protein